MLTVAPDRDLRAIGRVASDFGVDVDRLLDVIEELRIPIGLRVDGVPFLTRTQVEKLRRKLSQEVRDE